MKSRKSKISPPQAGKAFVALSVAVIIFSGCQKNGDTLQPTDATGTTSSAVSKQVKQKKHFVQVNLVANNNEYPPARIDPVLRNAWGLAFSSTGVAWIGAQGGQVSTIYNSEGVQLRPPVNIPSPGGPAGGNPTGVVFSSSATDFRLPAPNNQPARFLFVGVDGVVSGWNGAAGNNAVLIKNNVSTSAYTGLTLANSGGANFLYAADFRAGKIAVFDNHFNNVSMPFTDPGIPAGYSPFNIQAVDNMLYVTYAKVGPNGRSEDGLGKGYVDIYSSNGTLVKRFVSNAQLDAPWGIAKAPATFFDDDNDDDHQDIVLVGNFGNGHINAYRSDGKFIGELAMKKSPIVIERLWAISFAPAPVDPNRLYFTAGPDNEEDGIFGYVKKDADLD